MDLLGYENVLEVYLYDVYIYITGGDDDGLQETSTTRPKETSTKTNEARITLNIVLPDG